MSLDPTTSHTETRAPMAEINLPAVQGAALKFISDDGDTEFADLVNAVLALWFPNVEWCDGHDELNLAVRGNNVKDVCFLVGGWAERIWESSPEVLRATLDAASLFDADTGDRIRVASVEQIEASLAAGETGIVLIDEDGGVVEAGRFGSSTARRVFVR